MVGIEALKRKLKSIRLVELIPTVMRLRLVVYAYYIEARPLVALRCSTSPTE